MEEKTLHLYQSKIKLILRIIILFPFMVGVCYLTYIASIEQAFLGMMAALFLAVFLSVLIVLLVHQLIRNQPSFTMTNAYIKLDPQTKKK